MPSNIVCSRCNSASGVKLARCSVLPVSLAIDSCTPWFEHSRSRHTSMSMPSKVVAASLCSYLPDACQVMRWMEQCAYIAASRIGRSGHLLTGSLDSLAFAQPTRVGDIMYVTAQVDLPTTFALLADMHVQ